MQITTAMSRNSSEFGWSSLFRYYGAKGFMKDSILPFGFSIAVCLGTHFSAKSFLEILKTVIALTNNIVPAMIGLVLAAYTILLTFFTGESFRKATESEDGRKFIKGINAGFAACITLLAICIIVSIFIAVSIELEYSSEYAEYINMVALFVMSFLLSYSITSIFGIIIDIYNSGQTTTMNH